MSGKANVQRKPAPVLACTVARDIARFDRLIQGLSDELGEAWGNLGFQDALAFLNSPASAGLAFVAIAVDAEDEGDLSKIGQVIKAAKDRRIKILLIAKQVSPTLLYQMQKLGADDFVPYPLPDGALHEAIERLRRPAPILLEPTDPARQPRARRDRNGVILAVQGMAGGVGATTFAANLGFELALLSGPYALKVCVIDLDLQFGAIATYLDLPRKEAVVEALADTASLDPDSLIGAMATVRDRLHVLTAPADMVPLDMLSAEDVTRILDLAQASFDFVVIDMPRTVVGWTETILTRSQVYFALFGLDLRSAQNLQRFIRTLKAEGLPQEKLRFVLNRAPGWTDLAGKARLRRMAESLEIRVELTLPDGGRQVAEANDNGLPIAESAAKNALRKELQKLAKSLFDLARLSAPAPV